MELIQEIGKRIASSREKSHYFSDLHQSFHSALFNERLALEICNLSVFKIHQTYEKKFLLQTFVTKL